MTPVLFLAWYFPPIGGAGVQRSLNFTRYLPDHGIQPVVLAGPAALNSRWAPDDQSLAAQVPDELVVIRPDGVPCPGIRDRALHRLSGEITALTRFWTSFVLEYGTAAAARHGARAIVVTLGPYECLAGALALGERTGLPVIADLRDPWALDEMRSYGHRLQQFSDVRRMRRQLERCALVVMNTPEAERQLGAFLRRLPRHGITCITNGYDHADFESRAPDQGADEKFHVVHTGYLHTDSAIESERSSSMWRLILGGRRHNVDLWGRTHRYLLRALDRLAGQAPELAARVKLNLHGVLSESDAAEIANSKQRDQVTTFGYCPHTETVQTMRRADLLFLPMQGLPAGRSATIVPGKTYEYLASGRPILAAVPAGDARDFVTAAGAGTVVDPDDTEAMATALHAFVAAGRAVDRELGPAVRRFERRVLTGRLADAIGRVL